MGQDLDKTRDIYILAKHDNRFGNSFPTNLFNSRAYSCLHFLDLRFYCLMSDLGNITVPDNYKFSFVVQNA